MEPYQLLEVEFAEWNGLDPAEMVACSSGTAALHLALEAFRLPPGSEVIVPDYTMVAVPRAVTLAGLKPRFVDSVANLTIDPQHVWNVIDSPTADGGYKDVAAAIAVAVYGRKVDERVWDAATAADFPVIEDLAEAHGVAVNYRSAAACWSMYRNKAIGGEEGGAVWFKDPEHAALARQLRSLGFTDAHDYTHVPRGHNYRLANCLADRVRASLRCADTNVKMRRIVEAWYDEYCPAEWRMPRRDAVWVYDFRVPGMDRATQTRAVRALQAEGVAARFGFVPMTMQAEYGDLSRSASEAWRASSEVIYLPCVPFVTREEDCQRAFDLVGRALKTTS